jgi:pimeloyl-ACP methyl ester carboxylesterase
MHLTNNFALRSFNYYHIMALQKRYLIKYIRTKFALLSAVSKKKAAKAAFHLFCTPQYKNTKPLPASFEKSEQLEFTLGNDRIRGYRWNHPASKKILILHGFESSVVNFDRYVGPLVKKGYEVLGFDAPAHGKSTGKEVNVLMYKNMIQQIYVDYGPIDAFLSHSFGGLAVSLFLETLPNNGNKKVVLVAPAMETKTAADHFFKLLNLDESVRKEFDRYLTKLGGNPPEWYSILRAANNIKAQVLFLQDKHDEMTPISDVNPLMEKHYPNFHFIISEGLGHRRIYRDSGSTKAILEFL